MGNKPSKYWSKPSKWETNGKQTANDKWVPLENCPNIGVASSNIVAINENEFVIATKYHEVMESILNIYKFDIASNKWSSLIVELLTTKTTVSIHISFDCNTNRLYIYISPDHLIIFNINTLKNELTTTCKQKCCSNASSIISNNSKYHLIGGERSNKHLIFNYKTNQFDENCPIWPNVVGNSEHGLIYIKTQNKLFVFGGLQYYYDRDTRSINEIWTYTSNERKWSKLDLKLPDIIHRFAIVITSDDRYIIFFGGYTTPYLRRGAQKDTIYVLDLEWLKFYESDIKCPKQGIYHAVIMSDISNATTLIYGFVRYLMLTIPHEIIKLISRYIVEEYVYLINQMSQEHWKTSVQDIIRRMHAAMILI